ncbi:Sphingosine-1-phosphate lyase [Smittium culicis]|uniref:sphinganine-1-phosphate aldolase n=1 Tax=Smittium culicis TaxID=133412 RepID=A0A1R1XZS5_9FUNG|nr:Sphingosine-1-phosphate lyase [Smittium culicis]
MNKAIGIYNITNPLHPDVFPGLRRLDAEVVSMVLRMFNSPEDGCGTTTSGGTESIIMAVRAHLEKAKKERNVTNPNLVAPVTIHTAFDKACGYFNIELIRIPIDNKSGKVDIHILEKAINKNTIMIAGSAINYPHGVMDDIETMASIAMKKGIGMHVDCCLGSFLMPFMEDAGFKIPNFDFRVPGVTSISCDTHKYGFAPKGSSVIMYSNRKLRHYQYFVCTEWPGGIYASPTIAGSSSLPGSLIAGCWAALVSIGKEGYITSCRNIVNSRIKIQQGIESIDELEIIGEPICSVVAFSSNSSINIYAINDAMKERGWGLSVLQYPPALHIACTALTVGTEDVFIQDLKSSISEVKANPENFSKGSAAMYGMSASLPDRAPVEDITRGYLDSLYST